MRKLTYEQVKEAFGQHGLQLLTENYSCGRASLPYRCTKCGHLGTKKGQDARSGYGCIKCGIQGVAVARKATLEQVRRRFDQKGLQLLSAEYLNSAGLLKYRCKCCSYVGSLTYAKARCRGCKRCSIGARANMQKLDASEIERRLKPNVIAQIERIQSLRSRVRAVCKECHREWTASVASLIETGCRRCSQRCRPNRNAYSQSHVATLLSKRGFELLTPYENSQKQIELRALGCGHTFQSTLNNLSKARGCPRCAPNAKKVVADYRQLAHLHGGKLVRMANGVHTPSVWRCSLSHIFSRSYSDIKALETFCTKCSGSHSEMLCKELLRRLFGQRFIKVRPRDLRSSKGRPLELDFYCKKLRLAVEHDGAHHYEPQLNWSGEDGLREQQRNDSRKLHYCQAQGILLVRIRELGSKTSLEAARKQLHEALMAFGGQVPSGFFSASLENLRIRTQAEDYYREVERSARLMSIKILEKTYLGAETKVRMRCLKCGCETMKSPRSIKDGHGCLECRLRKIRRPVRTSDGRAFPSGVACALALGTSKETVNRAAKRGTRVNGLKIFRVG